MKKYQKVLLASTMVVATVATTSCGSNENTATTEAGSEAISPATTGTITGRQLMQNPNARKAIALGYNKQYIVDSILNDGSLPADYFVPTNFILNPEGGDYRDGTPAYTTYDIEKAKEYWAKAKEELGFETVEVELKNFDTASAKTVAEFVKSELEQNLEGLTLTITPLPFEQKLDEARAGNFDIIFSGWGPDYLDATTYLDLYLADGPYNNVGYKNTTYDSLVKNDESDPAARYKNFMEAERLLLEEDCAISPVYQRGLLQLLKPEVSGIVSHSIGADYTYQWVELDREDKVLHLLEKSKAPTLDTNMATDAVSFNVLNAINENLVSLGQDGITPIPGVATTWDVSEDGLTYTFHLRDDATFVDYQGNVVGNVTAQSFVDSWARLEDETTAAQYGYFVRDVANMESYTAVDDYTLEVKLTKETPWFLSLLAFPVFGPVDQASIDKFGTSYGTTLETTISSGPFYLTTWNFSERLVVAKNPNYFAADEVKIDGVDWRVIESVENTTSVEMYFAGDIDRTDLLADNADTYGDHADVITNNKPTVFYFEFNVAAE